MKRAAPTNINTPAYWDGVFAAEVLQQRPRVDPHRLQQLKRWAAIRMNELGRTLNVLDVGCGLGDVGIFFNQVSGVFPFPVEVSGIDVSSSAIAACQVNNPKDRYKVASAEAVPWPDERFDLVWCGETLEHVDDPGATLSEISRVCGEGGLIVISTPYRGRNRSPEHVWEYEPRDIWNWGNSVGEVVFYDTNVIPSSPWLTMFAVFRRLKRSTPS